MNPTADDISQNYTAAQPAPRFLSLIAWPAMLFVSLLPDILFTELTGSRPAWLFWAKIGLLAALFLVTFFWQKLHALRLFFIVASAVYIIEWVVARFFDSVRYESWLANAGPFVRQVAATQIPRLAATLLLVIFLRLLLGSFRRFFFVKGDLSAPARPIPWILDRPPAWKVLGPAISAAMCLGLAVFVFAFGGAPSLGSPASFLPLLPFVILFALINSLGEEMLYRAPWLAALEAPLGGTQAILLAAVFFGIGHYYGVPYGILGCVMAFIPGYLMGKAILETRGFFWAWFIHFWMDVTIFTFMALGSVTPGG